MALVKKTAKFTEKQNMTQGEFADRLGVTSQAVSKWENELCYPDITLIPSIATILGGSELFVWL